MITRITGILESIEANAAVITPMDENGARSGVSYEVLLTAATVLTMHARIGHAVTLHTLEHLEQQAQGATMIPRLLGFASPEERRFFQLFTTVKGVGSRKALRALAAPVGEVAQAIARRDVAALKRLPEIGARLAETVVAELSGKVEPYLLAGATVEIKAGAASADGWSPEAEKAVGALVRLGEARQEAESRVRRAVQGARPGASADEIVAAAFAAQS